MNEAFARFVASESGPNEGWEDVHPLSRIAAHFWLHAFVREVERRRDLAIDQDEGELDEDFATLHAFKDTVREFGLDGEGEK